MKREKIIILAIIIAATALAVALGRQTARINLVDRDGQRIRMTVELAENKEDRERGLMYRRSLGRFDGMLFVYEQPAIMSFWMKNTLIPLDVIFFDNKGDFVSSATMMPCVSDPCPSYQSQSQARYALEVPAGFVKERGVKVGWKLAL